MSGSESERRGPSVANLREVPPGEAAAYGGKASGLVRLLQAGARVPEGFAVEAAVRRPEEWPAEAKDAFFSRLGPLIATASVAVRSSALCEDSAERSFAGLFETVLGVRSQQEALDAAARCIGSGGSSRVLSYAGAGEPLPVGLVVQRLVPAAKAGVCFTKDPLGKDRAVVIEAVEGLGDSLVSGRSEPERWRAYRSGLGGWECRCEGEARVLGATEAARIASEASSLEEKFGSPLDLEWALDDAGVLWWLQARPITSLKEPPSYVIRRAVEDAQDGPVTVWSNWNVRETVPDPMMPLTFTFWTDVVLPTVGVQFFGLRRGSRLLEDLKGLDQINGRIYFNMNCGMAIPVLGWLTMVLLNSMDPRAARVLRPLIKEGVLGPRRVRGSAWTVAPAMAAASVRGLLRFRRALSPISALKSLERDGASIAARPPHAGLTDVELFEELRLFEKPEHIGILFGLHMETVAIVVYHLATRAFRASPGALDLLATGLPANPTTQISLGIEELAEAAEPLRELFLEERESHGLLSRLELDPGGPEWLGRFRGFLERFGHRGPMEFDLGSPRWSDNPAMILDLVRGRLAASGRERVGQRMERLGVERRKALAEAFAAAPFWKRPYLRLMARLVELYMPLREAPKHYGMVLFTRCRSCALELGRRLAAQGALERPEDVFFLELGELEAVVRGRRPPEEVQVLIPGRRALHERFLLEKAPDFLRSDGVPVEEEPERPPEEGVLVGAPISSGRASGPVKVLNEPDPSVISDGDVLVMAFADPGWTPLFPMASAVVMEVGGAMCHAAVVAREMGIPAVFGVRGAATLLRNGQRVTVDGSAGTVKMGD